MTTIDDIAVLTSENVRLNYTLAGMGSRVAAFLADNVIIGLVSLGLLLLFTLMGMNPEEFTQMDPGALSFVSGIFIVAITVLQWGYYFFFEWLNWGQTPGKQLLGIRVGMADGAPVDLVACALRNLVRFVDLFLAAIGVTFFIMIFTPRYQRLGDLVAGTVVIRRRRLTFDDVLNASREQDRIAASRPKPVEPGPGTVKLRISDAEKTLLSRFIERRNSLPPDVRLNLAKDLAARLRTHMPGSELAELPDEELISEVWKNLSSTNG
jgi:uncharacterized RDD family membrane protein YckC